MAFDKLEATPTLRDKPITPAAAMAAMAELFRLVTAQSHAYGGRHSRLVPAEVLETTGLLAALEAAADGPLLEDEKKAHDSMEQAYDVAVRLQRHMAESQDEAGLQLLISLLAHINRALDALRRP